MGRWSYDRASSRVLFPLDLVGRVKSAAPSAELGVSSFVLEREGGESLRELACEPVS